jgi:Zn-dependent peptidase ImmA (M78 family)/DNA-binding XRE family transcriptional regulator
VRADAQTAAALFDPQRLRLARQLSGLRRLELAELVGVSAAAISQFENGVTRPRPATLAELALRLNLPVAFFQSNGRPPISLSTDQTFFRSLRRTTQRDRERAAAHAALLAEVTQLVEERVVLPESDVPTDLGMSPNAPLEEVEHVAEVVRARWDLGEEPIANTVRLLERHGVMVARLPLLTKDVDAFSWALEPRPIVVLGSDKGVRERSRIDAAHELGHLVLHHADPEPGNALLERQAQAFAAALLVPASALREEWPREPRIDWHRLLQLKARWGMSFAALLYRARDLRLISPKAYETAMKYMSRRGWRVREPGPPSRPEEPRLLREAFRLLDESGVDLSALLERHRLPHEDRLAQLLGLQTDTPVRVAL